MDKTYLQRFLSDAAKKQTRNEIRELLKLIARPNVISLAGGLPPPDSFPVEELAALMPEMLRTEGAKALQYGATEGDPELKEHLIEMHEKDGYTGLTPDHILITSASQQGLDLCGRMFLAPGDALICGLPSYLGALGAFIACGARMAGVPLDADGIRPDLVEEHLIDLRRQGVRPKFIYVVPDFQNPAGVTLSLSRRKEILDIARQFDMLVIEDSPYRELRYVGETIPCMGALDTDGRVLSLFTFSKILCPGLRLGWIVGDPEIIARMVIAKQPVDLCTSGFNQLIAAKYLGAGLLPDHIASIREKYSAKREVILAALDRYVLPEWKVTWTRPEGGLFLWLTLPEWMNARELLDRALERDVAFVVGGAFHCDGSGENTVRLNFSYSTHEQLDEGVKRLAAAIESMIQQSPGAEAQPAIVMPAKPLLADDPATLEQLSWNLALSEVVG